MKKIHPAVAQHAMEENEKLRGLLAQALEFTEANMCGGPDVAQLIAEMRAALSQQAEPKCDTCHGQGEVWTGANQYFGYMSMQPPEPIMEVCPECGGEAEPAPAQDEREAVKQAIAEALGEALDCTRVWSAWSCGTMSPNDFQLVAEDDGRLDEIADAAISAMTTRPAQTEQPAAEPTTALDDRAIRLLAELSRAPQEGEKVSRDRMSAIIEVGHDRAAFSARLARRAQTEQQPVAWVEVKDRHEGPYEFHGIELLDSGKHDLFIAPIANPTPQGKFRMGDMVKKTSGSEWVGRVVGWYSTEQTKEGYAVESSAHRNSVQIYPAKALEAVE